MTGSTLLIANLFISIKSCIFNLVNYFFSAIADDIPKSLSLRSDDCNTVSTRSLDPGQHDDDPEVRRSTRPNKERRRDGGPRHRSGRR